MEKSEVEQFLEETKETSIVDQPLTLEPEKEKEEPKVEVQEEEAHNRVERRLREKLQSEREANIAMAARLEALAEASKSTQNESAEYLKSVERIYGTDTPEATTATELLKQALQGVEQSAYSKAIEAFREEQRQAQAEVQKEEQTLDSFIENIEDSYKVNLTPEMQKGYFALLEKMSPKDSDGNITSYADPYSVYELYVERSKKAPDNRAKDLAARSMTQSGSSKDTTIQDDATERMLRDAGIL